MFCKHEAKPQEINYAESRSQQDRIATLLKSHPRADTPPKKLAGHPQNALLQKNTSGGLLLYVKRVLLKDLNYK